MALQYELTTIYSYRSWGCGLVAWHRELATITAWAWVQCSMLPWHSCTAWEEWYIQSIDSLTHWQMDDRKTYHRSYAITILSFLWTVLSDQQAYLKGSMGIFSWLPCQTLLRQVLAIFCLCTSFVVAQSTTQTSLASWPTGTLAQGSSIHDKLDDGTHFYDSYAIDGNPSTKWNK